MSEKPNKFAWSGDDVLGIRIVNDGTSDESKPGGTERQSPPDEPDPANNPAPSSEGGDLRVVA